MKKILFVILCLFLLGLAACDDKETREPSVTANVNHELLTGGRSDKTTNAEVNHQDKLDRTDKVPAESSDTNRDAIEFDPHRITIPMPEPVKPPVEAETVEGTTTQE